MIDYAFKSFGRSDPGLVRPHNEDSYYLNDASGLWLVFDGMGGHENGALASQTAAAAFETFVAPPDFEHAVTRVADQVHNVNASLAQLAEQQAVSKMGTTAVGLVLRDRRFAIVWVGDSRAYIFRQGGLFQLTVDHTHVQDLLDQGILSPADAKGHPMSHVLTRALGVEPEVQVDIVQDEAEPGDRFLLCSDGLSGPVPEDDIRRLMALPDPQQAVDELIARAHAKGAPDNVTAIVVEIGSID
ncbi:PP2C family serine/threonine-protein phosphatase [Erythrobacter sp. JK5]|uniref:PP2C family protein-serine/threonine phosphatase n=1 Tax=Erythrobacter sp. JK5 TaxID=2829500 RepID=UPI001BA5388C|nr:protein phosphatase 2C domain-containing protein [Erythrobacter sp. JK5]QUL36782.1 serine/threonine-protein phosphatase [Erythrobacter sp. JK5]